MTHLEFRGIDAILLWLVPPTFAILRRNFYRPKPICEHRRHNATICRDIPMANLDIPGFIVALAAIVTALATVAIAFAAWAGPSKAIKTFRSQKWWEMRAHAYGKVVEALYKVQDIHDKYIAQEINGKIISGEEKDDLIRELRLAREEVRKFAVIGKFLLTEQAANRLKTYHAEVEREVAKWRMSENDTVSYVDILESQWAVAKSCLEDIQDIAEDDLDVK